MVTAEGLRAHEGKAESWEAEALSDYPVGQLEHADAGSGQRFVLGYYVARG